MQSLFTSDEAVLFLTFQEQYTVPKHTAVFIHTQMKKKSYKLHRVKTAPLARDLYERGQIHGLCLPPRYLEDYIIGNPMAYPMGSGSIQHSRLSWSERPKLRL